MRVVLKILKTLLYVLVLSLVVVGTLSLVVLTQANLGENLVSIILILAEGIGGAWIIKKKVYPFFRDWI